MEQNVSNEEFDRIYFASKHPDVRAIHLMSPGGPGLDYGDRQQRATELAAKGHIIDLYIDILDWSPSGAMFYRIQNGYQFTPSWVSHVPIKSSLDPADYPAWVSDEPVPPAPTQEPRYKMGLIDHWEVDGDGKPTGNIVTDELWASDVNPTKGQTWKDGRGSWKAVYILNPIAPHWSWALVK